MIKTILFRVSHSLKLEFWVGSFGIIKNWQNSLKILRSRQSAEYNACLAKWITSSLGLTLFWCPTFIIILIKIIILTLLLSDCYYRSYYWLEYGEEPYSILLNRSWNLDLAQLPDVVQSSPNKTKNPNSLKTGFDWHIWHKFYQISNVVRNSTQLWWKHNP